MTEGKQLEENQGRKRALIIGVSKYSHDLEQLSFCKNDGEEMFEILRSLGYEISDNFKVLGEAKADQMEEAIYDFFTSKSVESKDALLFFYSGHGIPDIDGDVYLASSEIDPKLPFKKGFSFNLLTKMMNSKCEPI